MPQALRPLIDALALETDRAEAAQGLARAIGARHFLLFVEDPEIRVMLPAPGMAKTLEAGASWRELLRGCRGDVQLRAEVDVLGRTWHALALAQRGCAFVLLGEAPGN